MDGRDEVERRLLKAAFRGSLEVYLSAMETDSRRLGALEDVAARLAAHLARSPPGTAGARARQALLRDQLAEAVAELRQDLLARIAPGPGGPGKAGPARPV